MKDQEWDKCLVTLANSIVYRGILMDHDPSVPNGLFFPAALGTVNQGYFGQILTSNDHHKKLSSLGQKINK